MPSKVLLIISFAPRRVYHSKNVSVLPNAPEIAKSEANTGVDRPFFICFFRSGLPSCLCFVRSGLPSRFQNCIGTPKNSRQIFCLSRQRRLLLGTAHKLKIKRILTRVMCFFVKGLLGTITSDRREI